MRAVGLPACLLACAQTSQMRLAAASLTIWLLPHERGLSRCWPCMHFCRARIEAIRRQEAEKEGEGESAAARQGRKLSTMRVDPKVRL